MVDRPKILTQQMVQTSYQIYIQTVSTDCSSQNVAANCKLFSYQQYKRMSSVNTIFHYVIQGSVHLLGQQTKRVCSHYFFLLIKSRLCNVDFVSMRTSCSRFHHHETEYST